MGTKQGRVRKGRRAREEVMKGAARPGEDGSLQIDVFSFQFTGNGTEETKSRGGGVERNEKMRFIQ